MGERCGPQQSRYSGIFFLIQLAFHAIFLKVDLDIYDVLPFINQKLIGEIEMRIAITSCLGFLSCLFLIVTWDMPSHGISASSRQLNSAGMNFYKKGKLVDASHSFRKAIEADKTNYLAHYNLACTLCLIRKKSGPCGEVDASLNTILFYLERSIELSPERRQRMVRDADLRCLHSTMKYNLLAGKSLDDPRDLREIIGQVQWSVYIDEYQMRINPHGRVSFRQDRFELEVYDLKLKGRGRFRTGKGSITLFFEEGNFRVKRLKGVINKKGVITIKGVSGKTIVLENNLDECSA